MEKFGWTPKQIDEIPKKKIESMLIVMNQRRSTIEQAKQLAVQKEESDAKVEQMKPGGIKTYREV